MKVYGSLFDLQIAISLSSRITLNLLILGLQACGTTPCGAKSLTSDYARQMFYQLSYLQVFGFNSTC